MLALAIISTILLAFNIISYIIRVFKADADNDVSVPALIIGIMIGIVIRTFPIVTIWILYNNI